MSMIDPERNIRQIDEDWNVLKMHKVFMDIKIKKQKLKNQVVGLGDDQNR